MENKKISLKNKIIIAILIIIMILICSMQYVNAASFSITSGKSEVTVGESYNITVNAKGLTGRFNITHSSNVSVNISAVWIENGVPETTIKVTTKSAGKATVTLTPAETGISDASGELVSVDPYTDTVTVKAKSTSSSNNSSSSGNSGSSSGNSGTQTTSAPSFSSVNETVYATGSVNVRSSYSTSSSIVGSLDAGDSVPRTGRGSNGWSRVTYNGQTAYISSEFLTTEKTRGVR